MSFGIFTPPLLLQALRQVIIIINVRAIAVVFFIEPSLLERF